MISFHCGRCGIQLEAEPEDQGEMMDCPKCGQPIAVPQVLKINAGDFRKQLSTAAVKRAPAERTAAAAPAGVTLTDIDLPFTAVLMLVFKLALANVLVLIPFFGIGLFVGIIGGCAGTVFR
jgi:DNA-directed RNA polymerase subunit RPC12/RpoP